MFWDVLGCFGLIDRQIGSQLACCRTAGHDLVVETKVMGFHK